MYPDFNQANSWGKLNDKSNGSELMEYPEFLSQVIQAKISGGLKGQGYGILIIWVFIKSSKLQIGITNVFSSPDTILLPPRPI